MSDQCKHCALRGDIIACEAEDCTIHESWYNRHKDAVIRAMAEALHKFDVAMNADFAATVDEIIDRRNKQVLEVNDE